MRPHATALSFLAFVTAAAPAFGAIVNVRNATELRAAIAAATAGDEIVLAAGTYAISGANLSCSARGTPERPIVVRSATPLAAKLELSTSEGFVVTGSSWHFIGLDVRGTCATDDPCDHAFHVTGAATGFVLRSSRVVDFNAQLKVNASAGGAGVPHGGLVEHCELFDTHARDTGKPVTKLNIDTGDNWIVRANYIYDFHRASGSPTYGAFMKSGGRNGVFERNLVVCTKDDRTEGTHIGLSFGGGGTGNQYCAPAFNKDVPCATEHYGGIMRNNIIANCSDVGIYINRGADTKLLHNTLIATAGIDFRFGTSSGEARGNVVSGVIRNRDGATHTAANNLSGVTLATFESMYVAPLAGDLRRKGDLSSLIGKGPMLADVQNDYCARPRSGAWDLGALQHALGDCNTVPPPASGTGTGGSGGSGGSGAGGNGTGGAAGNAGAGGASGSSGAGGAMPGGAGGSAGTASDAGVSGSGSDGSDGSDDGGCGCRTARGPSGGLAALIALIGLVLVRRWRVQ